MRRRLIFVAVYLFVLLHPADATEDRDYLRLADPKLTPADESRYDRAVREVLAQGWQPDVVVRTVALPPFTPEAVVGVLRRRDGFRAFSVTPSVQIWEEAGYGTTDPNKRVGDYSKVRPIFHDRAISAAVAARIASIWRRVLTDKRNYGKDSSFYLDTSSFAFYVGFLPGENLGAQVTGWGPKTEQLILITENLLTYSSGKSDKGKLLKVLSKAERKLGI